jgi:ABC-type transporter Mla subunit MlaD
VTEPLFWLGLSLLFVAMSLAAVLVAAIPALQELARAARSAEKLFDTLSRELPPTLDAIRMTSLEITDLTDDVSEGVKSAGQVVKQVDRSFDTARQQAQNVQVGTRSLLVGVKAAWKTFTRPKPAKRSNERYSSNSNSNQKSPLLPRDDWEYLQENRRPTGGMYSNGDTYEESVSWVSGYEGKFDNKEVHPKSMKPIIGDDWEDSE